MQKKYLSSATKKMKENKNVIQNQKKPRQNSINRLFEN